MQGLLQQLEGNLQRTMCELAERGELAVELDEQVTVRPLGCMTRCSIMSVPGMLLRGAKIQLKEGNGMLLSAGGGRVQQHFLLKTLQN